MEEVASVYIGMDKRAQRSEVYDTVSDFRQSPASDLRYCIGYNALFSHAVV
jgi:hypothetical protein